ncbi:hypothetical protein Cni_G01206 [Canna indica]|uniref:Uncharacterized protein n=1 Tax=Canna indica TaxID=4628 RepID=A0AAQ3Q0Q8_9LILI|nr:hypothetical protein Cni_G01206 [Canna indica]
MIKRRFYKQEHGDKDVDSSSSGSSSDSDSDVKSDEELEMREEDVVEEEAWDIGGSKFVDNEDEVQEQHPASSGSGYESEDSSVNEVEGDLSGLLANEDDVAESVGDNPKDGHPNASAKTKEIGKAKSGDGSVDMNDTIQSDFVNYILKHKSVFKCRLCPRIVCLSEDTVKTHLKSKRHTRSKKLLGEGRLKLMLNSDGEIEEDQETHSERHARTLALAEEMNALKKKDSGRQRQSRRRKKKLRSRSSKGNPEKPREKPEKKRQKTGA